MHIVGTHDELMVLKLACQKQAMCSKCVMVNFCSYHDKNLDTTLYSPLALFELQEIPSIIIPKKGDDEADEQ